jgi:hypothetical protein
MRSLLPRMGTLNSQCLSWLSQVETNGDVDLLTEIA